MIPDISSVGSRKKSYFLNGSAIKRGWGKGLPLRKRKNCGEFFSSKNLFCLKLAKIGMMMMMMMECVHAVQLILLILFCFLSV